MYKLKTIQQTFHTELDAIYGKDEVNSFFYLLIESLFDFSRITLALNPELTITKNEEAAIIEALNRLKNNEPIQYIIGETEFYGLPFKVNTNTLIPRPETEELVEWILESTPKNKPLQIIDIGTGTGCIAITLAKHLPEAKVYALDVSAEALKIAKHNAALNNVEVAFIEKDILSIGQTEFISTVKNFDIIVSNPPYVRQQEKAEIQANVLNHEPHLALFVENNNPLQFYKAITAFALNNLETKGQLFFEINEYLGTETKALLQEHLFEAIALKKDIFGKDRMLKAVKK
ncbi:peptide chain release factor N(5)-glutamine methyltransferase [Lacinutrix salivirga]